MLGNGRLPEQAKPSPLELSLGDMTVGERTKILRAFCDPHRVELLHLLRYGELCASGLRKSLFLSQPTLSYHMKILLDSGVIIARSEGRKTFYAISPEGLDRAISVINEVRVPLDRELYREVFCKHEDGECYSVEGLCPNNEDVC